MFALLAQIAGFLAPERAEDHAHTLLESAEARVGLDPHQAEELRQAARAYLSVVR